jgi:hypothetical protein
VELAPAQRETKQTVLATQSESAPAGGLDPKPYIVRWPEVKRVSRVVLVHTAEREQNPSELQLEPPRGAVVKIWVVAPDLPSTSWQRKRGTSPVKAVA